jgi:2-oxoisovalerate dehydrogenase E1 component
MSDQVTHDAWLKKASQIRAFEKLMVDEFGKGNVRGTFHTSFGQEITSVILADLLDEGDFIFGNHRSHAIYLALSGEFEGLAAEVLGREGASSLGIGGSQHLNYKNFYSNGIQGGMCSLAVGAAGGNKAISIALIGDGTLGEGAVYESLNLASVLKSRTLFILEDNFIAQSTITQFQRGGEISTRFEAFGVPYVFVDSNDLQALYKKIFDAIEHVRNGLGPFALHIRSYRLGAHSKGDDNRSQDEIGRLKKKEYLTERLTTESKLGNHYNEDLLQFDKLIGEIKKRPNASIICQNYAETLIYGNVEFLSTAIAEGKKIRDVNYDGLHAALSHNNEVLIIGEDIEYISKGTSVPYGGAFGVTQDLSELFPGQVVNSPISESAITGFGIGRALSGRPTIVEIMFGDFTTLTVDAIIQQASKIVSMYGKQIALPMLLRTPSGGRRGYGPTHSQNFENFFLGAPNIIVYSQNIFSSSKHYLELLDTKLPVMFFENKDLYSVEQFSAQVDHFEVMFSKNNNVILSSKYRQSKQTILTFGFATNLALAAANTLVQEFEIFTDVVIPQIVSPLNLDFAFDVLKSSEVVYLVEEGDGAGGLSGLLLKELQRLNLRTEVKLISGRGIIGASKISEDAALISTEKIVAAIYGGP